jgi:hypothetical protein
VQIPQRLLGRLGPRALHPKPMATPADLHIQARFDEAQIGIQRAAQAGQPSVVCGLELKFAGDSHGVGRQCQALAAA